MRQQAVAVFRAEDELVVDVAVRLRGRQNHLAGLDEVGLREQLFVARRVRLPGRRPPVEVFQLDRHHRRLQRIEAEIPADLAVVVLRLRAVVAQDRRMLGLRRVLHRQHAAVAEAAEILRREERETAVVADAARALPLPLRTDRLRGVFDHRQLVRPRHRHHRVHVRHLPVEMHRDDRLGLRRDRRGQLRHVEVERDRIDVHEDRRGPDPRNRPHRREKRVGRRDHFVARPDAFRHQRHDQRVRTRRHAHAVRRSAIFRDRRLALLNLRP